VGGSSGKPGVSQSQAAAPAQTPQQLVAALVGMTDTAGATVTSATVGSMCGQRIPAGSDARQVAVACSNADAGALLVPPSEWLKSGIITFAQGEIFLSDGTQEDASICADELSGPGHGTITGGDPSGAGMCGILLPIAPAPAADSAPAPATPTPAPAVRPVFGCYVNDNDPGADADYRASINIVSGGNGYSSAVVKVVIFDSHGNALQTQTVTAYSSTENWQGAIDPQGGPSSLATESSCTATVQSTS
jgi:hypothetical protein